MIEQISNESTYKVTHLKFHTHLKFQGENYVTATLISCINSVLKIDVSLKEVFFDK